MLLSLCCCLLAASAPVGVVNLVEKLTAFSTAALLVTALLLFSTFINELCWIPIATRPRCLLQLLALQVLLPITPYVLNHLAALETESLGRVVFFKKKDKTKPIPGKPAYSAWT